MTIKRRIYFECLKCKTIYTTESDAYNCECGKRCSSNINGFHSWIYLYSFGGSAFYKCKDCGGELTGATSKDKRKDPLDEIFVDSHKTTDKTDGCGKFFQKETGIYDEDGIPQFENGACNKTNLCPKCTGSDKTDCTNQKEVKR